MQPFSLRRSAGVRRRKKEMRSMEVAKSGRLTQTGVDAGFGMDHDIKLEAAIRWNIRDSFALLGSIKNDVILAVFQDFNNNLFRVWSFATLLPKMMSLADRYGRAGERVALQSSNAERSDPDFTKKSQEKIHAIVDAEEVELKASKANGLAEDQRILQNIKFILSWYAQPTEDGAKNELLMGLR